MANDSFISFVQDSVNSSLNTLLDTDAANRRYLAKLNSALIEVDCQAPPIQLLLKIEQAQIVIQPADQAATSTLKISGTAISLVKLLTTPIDNAANLRNSGVEVSGDVGLLIELSRVAEKIEIDWELLLAEKIGEAPAVILNRTLKTGMGEARNFTQKLGEIIKTNIKRKHKLPTKDELSAVKTRLRELNYKLDKLEAMSRQQEPKA